MPGRLSWSESEKRHALRTGNRIAAARIARGLTQDAVARKLRINQVRVSSVERGRSDLSRKEIAEVVGIYDSEFSDA